MKVLRYFSTWKKVPDASRPVIPIRTECLTKRYGARLALDSLSLEVTSGELFGLLGPNGAGKTTSLRLILGFIRPSAGRVTVYGESPRSVLHYAWRRRIGYLPGDLSFDSEETGFRLLEFYAALSGGHSSWRNELCDHLQLERSDLQMRIGKYSRGMKQKLGIIAALQHNPDLAILDEPTNALDPAAQRGFYRIVREMCQRGKTVLFSTHVLHEALELCEKIAVLSDGRLMDLFAVRQFIDESPRLLYVKTVPTLSSQKEIPHLPLAHFLGFRDDWLVYKVDAGAVKDVIRQLAQLPVDDVRIESAALDHLLSYYTPSHKIGT